MEWIFLYAIPVIVDILIFYILFKRENKGKIVTLGDFMESTYGGLFFFTLIPLFNIIIIPMTILVAVAGFVYDKIKNIRI